MTAIAQDPQNCPSRCVGAQARGLALAGFRASRGARRRVRFLLKRGAMRVLVVLAEPFQASDVGRRCSEIVTRGDELAVCCVLPPQTSLMASLEMQRKVTAVLRGALDGSAEAIPVFVVTQGDDDGIEECARTWGATEVKT